MEGDVLLRAQHGEADALAQLIDATLPAVYRFARRLCRSEADAQDATQDTLLSLSQNLSQYQGRGAFLGWVFMLTRSACSRHRRGEKNRPHEPLAEHEGLRSDGPDPESQAQSDELRATLQHAIDSLPADQREVIWLRDVEGLSGEDAAQTLGLSLEALKSRLHRARAELRRAVSARLSVGLTATEHVCNDVPDLVLALSQKLEGELSKSACAEMEAHVARCAGCHARCETLRRLLNLCKRQADDQPVPAALRRRIKTALQALQSSTIAHPPTTR